MQIRFPSNNYAADILKAISVVITVSTEKKNSALVLCPPMMGALFLAAMYLQTQLLKGGSHRYLQIINYGLECIPLSAIMSLPGH